MVDVQEPLLPESLLHERYTIKKTLPSLKNRSLYIAQDLKSRDKSWLINEFFFDPDGSITEEEQRERIQGFYDTLDVMAYFEHHAFPGMLDYFQEAGRHYMVTENIEGVSLRQLSKMSVEPFTERQILEWAVEIAGAIEYLHSRPKPLTQSALDPEHILINQEGEANRLKLINIGLERFFDSNVPVSSFSISLDNLTSDFHQFGETLYFLFTKKAYNPDTVVVEIPQASKAVSNVIFKCLSDDPQRNYHDAAELVKDLERILHLPAVESTVEQKEKKPQGKKSFSRYLQTKKEGLGKVVYLILSQKIPYFLAEVAGLAVLLAVGWLLLYPGLYYQKEAPVIICACRNELFTISLTTRKVIDRKSLDYEIQGMISGKNGKTVYLSDFSKSNVVMMETLHNKFTGSFPVEKNPSKMFLSGAFLYVMSESEKSISMVNTEKRQMTCIIPTIDIPSDISYSRQKDCLFISDSMIDTIHVVTPLRNRTLAMLNMPGGCGAVTLSPDGKSLYVANTKWDGLTVLDISTLETGTDIQNIGLKKASCLKFLAGDDRLFILDREGSSLIIFSTTENKVVNTFRVGKSPVDMAMDNQGNVWVANCGSHNLSVVNIASGNMESFTGIGRSPSSLVFIP